MIFLFHDSFFRNVKFIIKKHKKALSKSRRQDKKTEQKVYKILNRQQTQLDQLQAPKFPLLLTRLKTVVIIQSALIVGEVIFLLKSLSFLTNHTNQRDP